MRPKAVRRVRVALAFGVFLLAGFLASGAFGMVSVAGSDTTSTAGDTTSTATDAGPATPQTQPVFAPTISSDKGDYLPGELVTLRGTNWYPGEAVHVSVNDDQGNTWERNRDVLADATGNVVESFNLPNWFVATYSVVATGAASGTAIAAFTDSNPQAVQIGPGSLSIAPGSSAAYTITVPMAGSDGSCTVDLSVSGLPSGAAAAFGSTSLAGAKGESPSTSLTVATTSGTPLGTAMFTVTAARQSNCQGNGSLSGTANLVVAKSVGVVAVGSQTGTLSAGTAGSATYSVTVSRNGATGSGFTANLSTTGMPAGATASFNPSSLSFATGDTSKTSTLTINTTSGAAAGSTPFTVRATNANVSGDVADGNGSLLIGSACTAASVTAQPSGASISYGANATFTAAGGGNPAPSVQWQVSANGGSSWTNLSGETGTTLVIAKPGVSQSGNQYRAIFTNTCAGAQIAASNAATLTVAAKAITVMASSGQSKQYGASDPTLMYSSSPALESGDSFSGALGRAAGENVGSYAITLGNLSAGPNYSLSVSAPVANFVITKKAASVTAEDKSKVYGSGDPALTTSDSGFLAGDLGGGKITFSASRTAGESVAGSPYTITPAGSDGATNLLANYDVTYNTGKLTITKKAIAVTADDKTKTYGSPDPALTVSVPAGALEDGDSLSGSLDRAPGNDVGTYAITKGSLSAGGNYDLTVTPGTLTITKKAITVRADDQSKVYGSADPQLSYKLTSGSLEQDDSLTGSLSRDPGESVAGSPYAINQGSLTAGGNYDVTYIAAQLTITKAPLTITAENKSKLYGAADPAFTATVEGLVNGDNRDSLSPISCSSNGVHVGSHPITCSGGTSDDYDTSYHAGTLTITPKAITVAADDKTKTYGDPDPALTVTVPAGALEQGDSLSGELSRAPGEDVGSYPISKGSLSAGENYELTVSPGMLTITKAPLTVNVADKEKVYGEANPALTGELLGIKNDDQIVANYSTSATAASGVGGYEITAAPSSTPAGAIDNYAVTVNKGTLEITKKAASVTAEDKSKVYGSPDPALTTSDSGFLAGDLGSGKITFSASRAPGESVGGGPYTITASASAGTTSLLGNYDITYTNGMLTITKKAITGSFAAADKAYDGNTDATVTSRDLSGVVGGDAVGLAGGSAAFDTKNVGTKTVTLTEAALAGPDAGNYSLESVATAKANITPKPITVQADDKTKVYGSPDPALSVTVPAGALEQGDSLSGSLVRASGNNVGTYAITKGTLTAGGNYDLTVNPGTLTITKKPITVKADDKTKVYGSPDPALTVGVPAGALEPGDSLSGSLVRAAGNSVGTYAITQGSLTAGANYDLTVTPGTFTITKKGITVTADPQTKVVGASDPALTYKITSASLESGDSFSGALARTQGEVVGTYAITQGTLTAGANYDLTFVGSTLKIVYGWNGFLQPINDTAHQTGVQESKFKLGQTIPAQFVLKNAAGGLVQQATAPTFSRSGNLGTCDSTAVADSTDVVTPDAGVTYTWDGSQYHYNWSTKNLTAGEYRIYANLADGTKQYVDICLTK